ncbi:MAG: Glycosyl transferase group 1 [candidate division WS6 bacterium GW2011_GWF2_39_15]|uniref:Glycosyl transferase group 1 n=1 Tax=candidate division WS6 bacterium GW2011_GWF2_39_15 TaxID=1619100 RepID=A0A0G0Q5Z2_9BACT|nr:MAG: Glycosyl transferase group 1 [candidate division WS6 bacterium GW2011_GWF2_39_15]
MSKKGLNLSTFLEEELKPIRAIYLASYVPMKCGIATFTKDLVHAINDQNPDAPGEIVCSDDGMEEYTFPWDVKYKLSREDPGSYVSTAQYINQSTADIVCLQHEFGIYGGNDGEYVLTLIDLLEKPIVSCFHTILPHPTEHQKYIMQRIIEASSAVIAMSEHSRRLLVQIYGCDEEDAVLIHHGVPNFEFTGTERYKKYLGIKAKHLLMMSGLIGPGKGIEYVIKAMPEIVKQNPDTKFYIQGKTHPGVIRSQKESYRESLINLTKELQVEDHVVFINQYLSLEELIEYYKAADFFLTPHLEPQQPTSGTLAYALGAGKVCISTPFVYAQEMLSHNTGILVPFRESAPIADAVNNVISKPELMETYRNNAYKKGKTMQWPRVASKYLNLFKVIIEK